MWLFGELGCQNDDFFTQVSKIKLSIVSRCRRCKNNQTPLIFSMILRLRSCERLKKTWWKSYEKLKLKPDMHVWWMFARFSIDFQRISGLLRANISFWKSLGINFGVILSLFWDHGGALERWWGAWCWKIALRTRGTWRRTSIFSPKVSLRASWKFPKAFPKASRIE